MSNPSRREPLAHTLMFWTLTGMAVAAAVPCFLVPPIDAYMTLLAAEQRAQANVQHLEGLIAKQVSLQDALRTDPQVNVRLAQRELAYRPLGEMMYIEQSRTPTPPKPIALTGGAAELQPPGWMMKLYPQHWAKIYRRQGTRYVVLSMSILLIIFALVGYGERPAPVPMAG